MGELTLTRKEQNRLQVLNGVLEDQISVGQAAEVLGVSERHVWRILAAYRKEGAAADPRFDSHMARTENNAALLRIITDRFMELTRDEWAPLLDEGRCLWAPVQTLDEVIDDP